MKFRYIIYLSGFLLCLASCVNDSDSPSMSTEEDGGKLLITAGTSGMLSTKGAYETDDEGNVSSGIFYLTYPTTDSKASKPQYNRMMVDFSKATYYEKYNRRYTFTESGESGSELTNDMIGSSPNMIFLDNVEPLKQSADNDTLVIFPADDNPYIAGLMTPEKDILWGSEQKHPENLYDFDLHHVMAGVRVKITVEEMEDENLVDLYDLTKAEVYLTDIVLEPYSFNRLSGLVKTADNPDYAPKFMLVNNMDVSDSEKPIDWKMKPTENSESDDNKDNPVYITQDFILPPQTPSDDHWPELVVRFPNPTPEEASEKPYKEFYGKIPKGMFTNYDEKTNYGLDLSFLREHILEIRTKISQNPPQLIFMPVKVYRWVYWGPYTVIGHQEGIYQDSQLYAIIGYYQNNNIRMLERFGEIKSMESGNLWVFNIFSNITVELDKIKAAMKQTVQNNGVYFQLNGYKVKITDEQGSVIYTVSKDSEFNALIVDGILPPSAGN